MKDKSQEPKFKERIKKSSKDILSETDGKIGYDDEFDLHFEDVEDLTKIHPHYNRIRDYVRILEN